VVVVMLNYHRVINTHVKQNKEKREKEKRRKEKKEETLNTNNLKVYLGGLEKKNTTIYQKQYKHVLFAN
jgi:hypothetical protein